MVLNVIQFTDVRSAAYFNGHQHNIEAPHQNPNLFAKHSIHYPAIASQDMFDKLTIVEGSYIVVVL
uniref:Uncharacterized protein n=1 Tax=Oryza rufipogon TaxID=4529 RepID=A0A0E0R913_ORYRU